MCRLTFERGDEMARFVLHGSNFDFERKHVENAVKGHTPGPIQKYAVAIQGKEWPIKQVVRLLTHLGSAEFTAHDAHRVLQKIGYEIIERY